MQKHENTIASALMLILWLAVAQAAAKPLDFMWVMRSWDLPQGQEMTALAMSSDGARVALAGHNFIALLDRETGKEIWHVQDPAEQIAALHFSPDGQELIVARGWSRAPGKAIAILDAATGKVNREIAGPRFGARDAVPSPDGKFILSRGGSGYSRAGEHADLWDAHSGQWLSDPPPAAGGRERDTESVAFLPDSKHYLCGLYDCVRMHETRTGNVVRQLDTVKPGAMAVSPTGDRVVFCDFWGRDGVVTWDLTDRKQQQFATSQRMSGAAFISDGLCLTWGQELRLWNARTGEEVSWSGTYEQDVKLAATGGNYAVGGSERHLRVWGLPGIGTAPADATPLAGRVVNVGSRPIPPLVLAAERGDERRVSALLSRGADINAMRGHADRPGTTALHVAVGYPTYRALVDAGADVNAVSSEDWNGTPLHYAVERQARSDKNDVDAFKVIDLLLDKGANIEATYGYNETPLQTAAKAGNKQVAAHLAARGAYYDIFSAAALGDVDRIRALLKEKPELAGNRGPMTGRNALYWSTSKEVIDVLLQAGAETNIADAWGATPAKDLRGNRHEDLADYLESKTRR